MLFETGYGPSGLPHIGTFNEVLRTTMVRHAYDELTGGAPTRLIAFSDDMDGLRKVPDNVPQPDMLAAHLGKPLTQIPDPFGTHDSFAAHNNAMLRHFLDRFGFDYEFASSTELLCRGALRRRAPRHPAKWDEILGVMLPTLREERRLTYSPILPISPSSGSVLQVPVEVVDADAGTIAFTDEDGARDHPVRTRRPGQAAVEGRLGDALGRAGRRLRNGRQGPHRLRPSSRARLRASSAARPPEGFNYEMFLDEKGEKISKSKGNGLTLDQWLSYGSEESLAFFAYREPRKAKSLHLGGDPARGRRISPVPRQLCRAGDRAEARQSGPPHSRRQGARYRSCP